MESLIYLFAAWNLAVLCLYGIDKFKAVRKMWRISETALILPTFLLGALGGVLGMIIFNHKTSKIKFRLLIPLAVMENIALIVLFVMKSGGMI